MKSKKMQFKSVLLFILILLSIETYAQCENGSITYYDSTDKVIEPKPPFLIFHRNDEMQVVMLESLNLKKFINPYQSLPFFDPQIDSSVSAEITIVNSERIENDYNFSKGVCTSCSEETMDILDSVDVNNDGIKEIIILRKGACTSSPVAPRDCCGVGVISQSLSQYEIWNPVSRTRLFKIRNQFSFSEALTVNVGYTDAYRFDFEIDKKGRVHLSNHRGNECGYEMGMYLFDAETNSFQFEKP